MLQFVAEEFSEICVPHRDLQSMSRYRELIPYTFGSRIHEIHEPVVKRTPMQQLDWKQWWIHWKYPKQVDPTKTQTGWLSQKAIGRASVNPKRNLPATVS